MDIDKVYERIRQEKLDAERLASKFSDIEELYSIYVAQANAYGKCLAIIQAQELDSQQPSAAFPVRIKQ